MGAEVSVITIRRFAPGEAIIRENEFGETAFFIEKGRVAVTRELGGRQVHLAFMETGAAFGEMSLVDDSPRSATITAVEATLVREIHRENIRTEMKEHPEAVLMFLKNIFERLREANMKVAKFEGSFEAAHAPVPPAPRPLSQAPPPEEIPSLRLQPTPAAEFPAAPAEKAVLYSIEGLTPKAVQAMSDNPFRFSTFPIKIGRKTNDPLVNNHLEIADTDPLQISRHHVSILREHGKIGVVDRGSHLGALVDDVRVGGKKNGPGPVFFKGEEGILVLGTDTSPYRYKIKIVS